MARQGQAVEGFPEQLARTGRFTYGVPRAFTVSADGRRVLFVRSGGGRDAIGRLWLWEDGAERLLATGVEAYAADAGARVVAYAAAGELWTVRTDGPAEPVRLETPGAVLDPRPSPDGRWVAYLSGGALHVVPTDGGGGSRVLAAPEGPEVAYGVAEHVAASMARTRGYWWAPDGSALLVARVDNGPVERWYLPDLMDPAAPPREIRYPAVGTANADVSVHLLRLDGVRREVAWDRRTFEYLTAADWDAHGPLISVQSRDQCSLRTLSIDESTAHTTVVDERHDAAWAELVPGTPLRTESGALVTTHDDSDCDTRRLAVDGVPVTPPGLQVREVLAAHGDAVLFTASDDPTETHVWRWVPRADPADPDGPDSPAGPACVRLTTEPGVHSAVSAGGTTVLFGRADDRDLCTVLQDDKPAADLVSLAERPLVTPRPTLLRLGPRELNAHLYLPSAHRPGSARLPVLLDPYGGQHLQLATRALGWSSSVSQWFAEQGFAVLVTDGRGSPGRGPAWEKAIHGDILSHALQDQVDALHAAAERHPGDLDLGRVAVRGWSFGGFLAAGAVLRRPDVFHAAVAGAPPTDQRLYDTHWKERYLGQPDKDPENYERSSLLADAPSLRRPLLLVHGTADDNVVVHHTLKLSAALSAAGRPHQVVLLPGVGHAALRREEVAVRLLRLQLDFLRTNLSAPPAP